MWTKEFCMKRRAGRATERATISFIPLQPCSQAHRCSSTAIGFVGIFAGCFLRQPSPTQGWLLLLQKGRVDRTVDLKGAPYRDALGNPVRGTIRKMLMEASGVAAEGRQADGGGHGD